MADCSRCPRCGTEVCMPVKVWMMMPKRKGGPALRITVYECPKCLKRWRESVKLGSRAR